MISAWWRRRFERVTGNRGSMPESILSKCALKVQIMRSAMLRWCISGSTFLVFSFPFVGDAVNVGGTGFIIKDVKIDGEAACLHAFHDGVVRGDSVCIGLDLKG